jgi:hypothetical protein
MEAGMGVAEQGGSTVRKIFKPLPFCGRNMRILQR